MNDRPTEILFVEDDPNDIELTLRVLTQYHLANRIEVVRDGAAALEFLLGEGGGDGSAERVPPEHPHLKVVLLDLKLPKIDGLEVLRRVKTNPRTQSIPVVVLTSSREERDLVESYRLGVNSYIQKPVDFASFSKAVSDLGMYWLLLNAPPPP